MTVSFETVGGSMTLFESVSSLFLFENTDFSALDRRFGIMDSVTVRKYSDGEIFFSCGSEGFPVILSGSAVIVSGRGEKSTVLRSLVSGDAFGAASLFSEEGEHRTVVRAKGDCSVAIVPVETIKTILENEPVCSMNYIRFLSGRISFLNRKIAAFTAGSAEAKLAVYLLSLPCDDGMCRIPCPISALSSTLRIGRASLYRAFDDFARQGIIEKDGRIVRLIRPEELKIFIK